MCSFLKVIFFWRCGHVDGYRVPSLHPECKDDGNPICEYNFQQKCRLCNGDAILKGTLISETGITCGEFSGKIEFLSKVRPRQDYSSSTPAEAEEKFRSTQRRFHETYISCKDFNYHNLSHSFKKTLKIVSKEDIATKQSKCPICLADFTHDANQDCSSTYAVNPCSNGHIFGAECLHEMIEIMYQTKCPLCQEEFGKSRDTIREDCDKFVEHNLEECKTSFEIPPKKKPAKCFEGYIFWMANISLLLMLGIGRIGFTGE